LRKKDGVVTTPLDLLRHWAREAEKTRMELQGMIAQCGDDLPMQYSVSHSVAYQDKRSYEDLCVRYATMYAVAALAEASQKPAAGRTESGVRVVGTGIWSGSKMTRVGKMTFEVDGEKFSTIRIVGGHDAVIAHRGCEVLSVAVTDDDKVRELADVLDDPREGESFRDGNGERWEWNGEEWTG
jgi:hypothetical protein